MSFGTVHGTAALVWGLVVGNLVLAVWAGWGRLRRRRVLPPAFWVVLLVVLAVLAIQGAAGVLLLLGGARPRAGLHLLYAVLVVGVGVAQYGLRPGGFVRRVMASPPGSLDEPRVLALLCFTQAALLMRAWMTGTFGR